MQDFLPMTEENKEKALALVDGLRTRNGTKIYDAIKYSMDFMMRREKNNHNPQMLFFTDGMDYYVKQEKCLKDLKTYKE